MIFAHFCTFALATPLRTKFFSKDIGHFNANFLMPILCTCSDLLAPEERGDGDEVAGEPADQEHHAAEEGGHQHPVRVVLTHAECRGGLTA